MHAPQVFPLDPQVLTLCWLSGTHFDPPAPSAMQQPLQFDASHLLPPEQKPPLHTWPPAQLWQVWPFTPHTELLVWDSGTQVAPTQQPSQVPGPQPAVKHAPAFESQPDGHAKQVLPPLPQYKTLIDSGGRQTPFAQQPLQLLALQLGEVTQVPFSQR